MLVLKLLDVVIGILVGIMIGRGLARGDKFLVAVGIAALVTLAIRFSVFGS